MPKPDGRVDGAEEEGEEGSTMHVLDNCVHKSTDCLAQPAVSPATAPQPTALTPKPNQTLSKHSQPNLIKTLSTKPYQNTLNQTLLVIAPFGPGPTPTHLAANSGSSKRASIGRSPNGKSLGSGNSCCSKQKRCRSKDWQKAMGRGKKEHRAIVIGVDERCSSPSQ